MNLRIRPHKATDLNSILLLIKELAAYHERSHLVTITPEQMMEDGELFKCLVAEEENHGVVGFASYYFCYFSWTGKGLYLDDLIVREEHRHQGIGKALLDGIIELAKETNCRKVKWQVSNWNTAAIEFYKKIGATIDDVEWNCELKLVK